MATSELAQLLHDNAPTLDAVVFDAPDMSKAFDYIIALCEKKSPSVMLIDEPGTAQGPPDPESGLPTRAQRVLAAVGLPDKDFENLHTKCTDKGWLLLDKNLRSYVSGIDVGVTLVQHAIADSATCIVQAKSEEELLACSLCEISVIIVPKSGLLPDMKSALPLMRTFMSKKTKPGGTYTSFITGSSRTGDIEQVLTLGAHGPVELHIILLEG